ncbi:MAG: two component transcriptional regulator, LytTR family [Bacteroidota bacterium]|jgi:DNA-binding LytR/AlgR family response regulator|nr:two component transcriptional regulator, LytTR family [Bacteroidota bacterium]
MNCIIVDDDEMIRLDLEEKIRQTMTLNLVASCSSAIEASGLVLSRNIDLIFLDVMMPGMTGMEFMRTLSASRPEVIMITSNKEFAAEAFDYDVTDFLIKPVSYERFLKAVTKAKRNFDKKGTSINTIDDHIFIKVSSRFIKLELKNIQYIEALADYVTIYTSTDKYTIHSTMKGIESTLPANEFARVHNSFIVRIDKILAIEDNLITIHKTTIPVSRNRLKPLMQRLKLI